MFRLRLTSVSGFPRTWLNIRWPCSSNRLRPLQTGRADFPHPACPRTFEVRQTSYDLPELRNPRRGKTLSAEAGISGNLRSMCHVSPLPRIRSRQGPFAPPALPGFLTTMAPSDSCPGPTTVIHSRRRSQTALTSPLPPEQVSQVPRQVCRRPLSPTTPESPAAASARCFAVRCQASPVREGWPLSKKGFTRPNRVHAFALRLTSPPSQASHPGSPRRTLSRIHGERAIPMVSTFQLTRPARLGLAHPNEPNDPRRTNYHEPLGHSTP